jgi:hypothetical protein
MAIPSPRPYAENKRTTAAVIIFVVFVTLLALAGTGLGAINQAQNGRQVTKNAAFAACLANYNNVANASTAARAQLHDETSKVQQDQINAVSAVVLAVANAKTPADIENALLAYTVLNKALVKEQTAINKQVKENPVPPPPSEVCKS